MSVGATSDSVRIVFTSGGKLENPLGRFVADGVTVGVFGLPQAAVCNVIEDIFLDPKALCTLFDRVGCTWIVFVSIPVDCGFIDAIVVAIAQGADVAWTGDNRLALCIEGHAKAIVSKLVIGDTFDRETVGEREREFVG
jgi:hypothetical protein